MKRNDSNIMARFTGITIALALLAGVAGGVKAQEKGATRLLKLSERYIKPKVETSDLKPMSCGKCKDEWVAVPKREAKGAEYLTANGLPTKTVAPHLCGGCDTRVTVVGLGKAVAHNVVTHKCTSCGAETLACCNTRKSAEVATKGMDTKFEVAPLK